MHGANASRPSWTVTAIARRWAAHLMVSAFVGLGHLVGCVGEELGKPAGWGSWVDSWIGAVARWGYR